MAIIHTKQKSLYKQALKYLLIGLLVAIIGRALLKVNVMITILTLAAFPLIAWQGTRFLVGALGEWRVSKEIKKFDNNYHLFNDIKIPGNQIDHILICPKGIYTIETKCYVKNVYYHKQDLRYLRQYYGKKYYLIKSPIKQGLRHSMALREKLETEKFIYTIVVFAGPAKRKMPPGEIPVLYCSELNNYLLKRESKLNNQQILYYTNQIKKLVSGGLKKRI